MTTRLTNLIAILALLTAALSLGPQASAQNLGIRPLRFGNTSGWYYDNRDDNRDFPTNGFFPGDSTADPTTAWLGIAGVLAGNSRRSPLPYPSQVVLGPPPHATPCARRHRSYDPTTGTFLGRDGLRHRC